MHILIQTAAAFKASNPFTVGVGVIDAVEVKINIAKTIPANKSIFGQDKPPISKLAIDPTSINIE